MKIPPRWRLRARALATGSILAAMYTVIVYLSSAALGEQVGALVGLAIGAVLHLGWGDGLSLLQFRGRVVDEYDYPDLHYRIAYLAVEAGVPKPDVAVSDADIPNAFAVGRSHSNATVCVTERLLETLDRDELNAVLAHELSHIKSRDTVTMPAAPIAVAGAYFVVYWGLTIVLGSPSSMYALLLSIPVFVVLLAALRSFSRRREFAADWRAAHITGEPEELANALRKITSTADTDKNEDQSPAAIPFVGRETVSRLSRFHPSTERRIRRLDELE